MTGNKTDIFVYADWMGIRMPKPVYIGKLTAQQAKGRKAFSFEYDRDWVNSGQELHLDPDLAWFSGTQYPNNKENFGIFLDSMPDTWGRTLMKRREAAKAKEEGRNARVQYDLDFLLGVYDGCRMGAIRLKLDKNGPFLDNNHDTPTPPWSHIRELQHSAAMLETNAETSETQKWLDILLAPGSSLGGARPKANIVDEGGNLWIAKFPSKTDAIDKAAWEYLAYKLALLSGIEMAESRIEKVAGRHFTFFTKRFDRVKEGRVHFASAMTMLGLNEEILRDRDTRQSYLDIAEFIQFKGARTTENLHKLWPDCF